MVVPADSLDAVFGPKVTDGLAALGLHTVGELLRYAPRRYLQRGQLSDEESLEEGEWVTVVGRISKAAMIPMRRRRGSFLKVAVTDGGRTYEASFFNARYIQHVLRPGTRVMLAGAVKFYRGTPQLSHPEWMVVPEVGAEVHEVVGSAMLAEMSALERAVGAQEAGATGDTATRDDGAAALIAHLDRPIIPIYPATRDMQTWEIFGAVRHVLDALDPLEEPLPEADRVARGLLTTDEALRTVHLPDDTDQIDRARDRLKFDEALAIQLVLAQRRLAGRGESASPCPHVPGGLEDQLRERLPFTLTEGQETVIAEIGTALGRDDPMSRLLQGEVGSGKTLVSLLAMLRVVDNGQQCVLFAPTEVLAAQHYRTISSMLGDLGTAGELGAAEGATRLALLTGSMRTQGKRQALLDVVTGTAGIVIGTHALLEENVEFFDLGLVVVDEQHRFGVEQRDVLRGRGRAGRWPHFLVMTATPIPRTIAMTAFGDLDTSVLTELPRGRRDVTTTVVPAGKDAWVDRMWSRAQEEIAAGRQVYVVCSRIGDTPEAASSESAAAQTTSVLEQYEQLTAGALADRRIEMLHGRLPADEKNAVMDAFAAGEVDVLVSTTVIEVGVDVPNAAMMVIVDAERFGVSQLHQLRGRVGRGQHPGVCLLMTSSPDISQAMERLRAVESSNDGFELARVDLQQRREGDVLGSLQSGGTSSLRFLSLLDDDAVVADARDLAERVVADDPTLVEHRPLADLVDAILVPQKAGYLDKS